MNRLIIIGASGHGKVVADIAKRNGYDSIVFLDDDENVKECAGFPVVGKTDEAPGGEVFVAVGSASARKRLMQAYGDRKIPVLIHPNATVADGVTFGEGTVVMAGAVINPGAAIGRGVIVNTSSSVDHDCVLGDYVHVAVGAHLCGTVRVGDNTWIGAGAVVSNNINVAHDCVLGAGAVVVRDIPAYCTAVGSPARPIKFFEKKDQPQADF